MTTTKLLAETMDMLEQHGKSGDDVEWIGAALDYHQKEWAVGTWNDFIKLAAKIKYDSGYGGNEIRGSLVIVGKDWWLERGEYDGSEWWEFKRLPTKPTEYVPLRTSDIMES